MFTVLSSSGRPVLVEAVVEDHERCVHVLTGGVWIAVRQGRDDEERDQRTDHPRQDLHLHDQRSPSTDPDTNCHLARAANRAGEVMLLAYGVVVDSEYVSVLAYSPATSTLLFAIT